ncbi:MAG: hypothetical protein MJ252_11775 [archaeon]|nr:hypothetical protein [archaeon]
MENKKLFIHNPNSNKYLLFPLMIILSLSLPNSIKCDAGEVICSMILFILFAIVIFAGIGWWSKRGENK